MTQRIFTPKIMGCAQCGADANVISWDFNSMYRVYCKNNHTTKDEYLGAHRAICKWNNQQIKLKEVA